MRSFFRKFLGISLITVACFGMLFSTFGAVGIWIMRTSVLTSLDETTQLVINTLETTSDGLGVVDDFAECCNKVIDCNSRND